MQGTARRQAPELRIGTSGWHYADWWGPFYPQDVRKKQALAYYASQFDAAELNAPFYRTPTDAAVENWRCSTPDDFRFAWKASRFITHWRRLIVDENSMALLESRLDVLGEKLGPVLFQLPPRMAADRERLAAFLKALPSGRSYSFEFRHPSWYETPILRLLSNYDVALCLSDHADAPAPPEATASFVYIRNHGPSGRYHGRYPMTRLRRQALDVLAWLNDGLDVWCFFDNDVKSAAPADARQLRTLVAARVGTATRTDDP